MILSRFLPIFRTFVPFVAGIAGMNAATHFLYNVIGAILWVFIFVFAGFFFGQIQVVQDNFSIVMIAILIITALPAIYALIRQRFFPSIKAPDSLPE